MAANLQRNSSTSQNKLLVDQINTFVDDVDLDHQVDLNQAAVGDGGGEEDRAGGLPAAQERQLKDLKDDKEGESRGEIVGILKKEGSSVAASPNASAVLSHVSRSSKRVSVEVAAAKDAAADKSLEPMRLAGVAEIEGEEVEDMGVIQETLKMV